ncbi:MAG TPA: NUDIX domain-containing protein [Arachidicoccus soli]|uniref:NUDIX domain-containing protein n=1 Tax=Arachidicoccus soli TaxID=2341117 RepID=A0A386HMP2_9BACT|nr:NUDIX domain-containing protein [Arachidicoccus soli]AYD47167.1 NUDIX domain-containing protein [Arachidicoccus soli]HEU0226378.1 NUDIX domain-containing protein [Arachidicoccus soli]
MQKHVIIAAGGLVTNESGYLLMIFRRGFWDLPKGKLDEGESIEQCAIREVEEETGLSNIDLGKLIGITFHDYFDKWTNQNVTKETHWFEMHVSNNQQLIPQTEEDIEKIEWVNSSIAKKYLQDSYTNIVDIMKKSGYV